MTRLLVGSWVCLLAAARLTAGDHPLAVDLNQSHLQVDVHSTAVNFTAVITSFQPEIRLDDSTHLPTAVRLRFPVATVSTGNGDRDKDLYHWEAVQNFPEVTFEMTRLQRQPDGHFVADGMIRLHGVEREVSFPLAILQHDGRTVIHGEAYLDTRDFHLPVIRKYLMLKVDPQITVRFHVEGR